MFKSIKSLVVTLMIAASMGAIQSAQAAGSARSHEPLTAANAIVIVQTKISPNFTLDSRMTSDNQVTVALKKYEELGRAWAEITVESFDVFTASAGDSDSMPETATYRLKINGLSYDSAQKKYVFQKDNQKTYFATGELVYHASIVEEKIDTGYEVKTRQNVIVTIGLRKSE